MSSNVRAGQVWQHRKKKGIYEIVGVGPIKECGKWLEHEVVCYRDVVSGVAYHRYILDFITSFDVLDEEERVRAIVTADMNHVLHIRALQAQLDLAKHMLQRYASGSVEGPGWAQNVLDELNGD